MWVGSTHVCFMSLSSSDIIFRRQGARQNVRTGDGGGPEVGPAVREGVAGRTLLGVVLPGVPLVKLFLVDLFFVGLSLEDLVALSLVGVSLFGVPRPTSRSSSSRFSYSGWSRATAATTSFCRRVDMLVVVSRVDFLRGGTGGGERSPLLGGSAGAAGYQVLAVEQRRLASRRGRRAPSSTGAVGAMGAALAAASSCRWYSGVSGSGCVLSGTASWSRTVLAPRRAVRAGAPPRLGSTSCWVGRRRDSLAGLKLELEPGIQRLPSIRSEARTDRRRRMGCSSGSSSRLLVVSMASWAWRGAAWRDGGVNAPSSHSQTYNGIS